jgi:hypothetical protein
MLCFVFVHGFQFTDRYTGAESMKKNIFLQPGSGNGTLFPYAVKILVYKREKRLHASILLYIQPFGKELILIEHFI